MLRPQAGIQVDKFYPPTDWLDSNSQQIDIRKNAENNSIVLLVGVKSDFSAYKLLGLYAIISSGTYDVYIDDVLVGSAITTNTQYDIDFSQIATSYGTATTPEALVLHKVVIKPTTSGATITRFQSIRTSGVTSKQVQGCLWCHFELENVINVTDCFGSYNTKRNPNMMFITAKGDELRISSFVQFLSDGADLYGDGGRIAYLPTINLSGLSLAGNGIFGNSNSALGTIKRIKLKNGTITSATGFVYNNTKLEKIDICNVDIEGALSQALRNTNNLKIIPKIKYNSTTYTDFLTNDRSLLPTKLDVSSVTSLTKIGTYGSSSYPMRGLRGLKVSNEAPFTGASPQIDVSYTGLDRDALVELFQSLPTVTNSQTLKCVACSGNNLAKVGSPTIDENGVASGFGVSSYIRTTTSMSYNNSFEMFVEFTFGNDITSVNQMILCEQNNNMRLWKLGSESFIKMRFYDSAISDFRSLNLTYAVQPNTTYKCKAVFKNSKLELFLYDGNNNLLEEKSVDNVKVLINQQIKYGSIGTSSGYFLGRINLPTSYIKEDTNYLVKGYLLDTDKAIATDKGWGLVLS